MALMFWFVLAWVVIGWAASIVILAVGMQEAKTRGEEARDMVANILLGQG